MERLIPLSEILDDDDQQSDARYIAERRRIEAAHSDGCERPTPAELRKQYETPAPPDDEPITDESPVSSLGLLGLKDTLLGVLDAAGIMTVGQLRRELGSGRLIDVRGIRETRVRQVELIFRRLDRR